MIIDECQSLLSLSKYFLALQLSFDWCSSIQTINQTNKQTKQERRREKREVRGKQRQKRKGE